MKNIRKKLPICLLATAATLTACVQIQIIQQREAGEPLVSFTLVARTLQTEATSLPHTATATPTDTPHPTDRPSPAPTATSTPTHVPTSTPTDTPTPTPTPCLPDAEFAQDVTVPDGTEFGPGEAFEKTWRIRSSGCAPWPAGTRWVFVSGDRMGTPAAVAVPETDAGGTADITVPMIAPDAPGTYTGHWRMQLPDGTGFGDLAYVQIVVPEPTPVPTTKPSKPSKPKPQATPGPAPTHTPPPP